MSKKGVYETKLKNGKPSFRASITSGGKHISLGSFATEKEAARAYADADRLLAKKERYPIEKLDSFAPKMTLPFQKMVLLCNYRDNGIYLAAPIYIYKHFFHYYLSPTEHLTFDKEDLFYYASHRIMRRGGHLFVADYGMQVTITGRYGIRPFSVKDRDYRFINGDDTDFRYANIEIINPYFGVQRMGEFGLYRYRALIHLRGNYIIGDYEDNKEAAIAYNKAADLCKKAGIDKDFPVNYIDDISPRQYADLYDSISISPKLLSYLEKVSRTCNPQS